MEKCVFIVAIFWSDCVNISKLNEFAIVCVCFFFHYQKNNFDFNMLINTIKINFSLVEQQRSIVYLLCSTLWNYHILLLSTFLMRVHTKKKLCLNNGKGA